MPRFHCNTEIRLKMLPEAIIAPLVEVRIGHSKALSTGAGGAFLRSTFYRPPENWSELIVLQIGATPYFASKLAIESALREFDVRYSVHGRSSELLHSERCIVERPSHEGWHLLHASQPGGRLGSGRSGHCRGNGNRSDLGRTLLCKTSGRCRPRAFAALAGSPVLARQVWPNAACCPDDGLLSPPSHLVGSASSSGQWSGHWFSGFSQFRDNSSHCPEPG